MKKRDFILIALAVAIIIVLWAAPPESTPPVPYDDIHKKFYKIFETDGKKAAETSCGDCHNPDGIPFPPDHPQPFRCLFCHKFQEKRLTQP